MIQDLIEKYEAWKATAESVMSSAPENMLIHKTAKAVFDLCDLFLKDLRELEGRVWSIEPNPITCTACGMPSATPIGKPICAAMNCPGKQTTG